MFMVEVFLIIPLALFRKFRGNFPAVWCIPDSIRVWFLAGGIAIVIGQTYPVLRAAEHASTHKANQ